MIKRCIIQVHKPDRANQTKPDKFLTENLYIRKSTPFF